MSRRNRGALAVDHNVQGRSYCLDSVREVRALVDLINRSREPGLSPTQSPRAGEGVWRGNKNTKSGGEGGMTRGDGLLGSKSIQQLSAVRETPKFVTSHTSSVCARRPRIVVAVVQ